jgi:two-component system, sensor histidine kinase RpfC
MTSAPPSKIGAGPAARVVGRLRQRLQARTDSEHEQVLIRCVIALAAAVYLAIVAAGTGDAGELARACLPLAAAYMTGSLALLAHLLTHGGPWPVRRYAGMLLDIAALTLVLVIGGEAAAVFFPFYLWVTFGMGFRYGRRYLLASAALSLVSFALVIALSDYWQAHPALAGGLGAALVILPAYASSLLERLTEALAKAEAASRAKSRFLATMSHELRTPLNAIIGMSDLLRSSSLDIEQRDMLHTVRASARTLLEMIDDVLDVAKVESGRVAAETVDFDLHELVATVRAMLHHQALTKGLELRVRIDPGLPPHLRGSARSLKQILINLVANGIKFTETGSVTLALRALDRDERGVGLLIEVSDTGIGIPADAQARIFERFAQADESTTRRYGGTGLGLAIARQLAEAMGARLGVDSIEGRGTRFHLRARLALAARPPRQLKGRLVVQGDLDRAAPWCRRAAALGVVSRPANNAIEVRRALAEIGRPKAVLAVVSGAEWRSRLAADLALWRGTEPVSLIVVAEQGAGEVAEALAVLPPQVDDEHLFNALHAALAMAEIAGEDDDLPLAGAAPRRILVAEDNPTNQKVIAKILERGGHSVRVVGDGEQALDALGQESFDLVLMDLNMPVMGGVDAVKLYRFAAAGEVQPAFVALSADITDETRRACAEAGVTTFVTKPVEAQQLLSLIARLCPEPAAASPEPELGGVVVPHPRLTSATPPLDRSYLNRLRALDDDSAFVIEVINDFLADAGQLIADLERAAQQADAVAFRDRAHALRSSAAHMGAIALLELCLGWRGIGSADLEGHGAAHVMRLRAEFARLQAALGEALEDFRADRADAPPARDPGRSG